VPRKSASKCGMIPRTIPAYKPLMVSPPYPKMYATHRAPVKPIIIGPMNCLKEEARYLIDKTTPINVITPQKISNFT
jgi:hypothetical protein